MTDRIQTLVHLATLVHDGRLTEAEYETLKREVLGNGDVGAPTVDATVDEGEGPDQDAGPDMYEVALTEGGGPKYVGWYPDPQQSGTHMRFYDGSKWTDSVRPRKPPGWYPDTEIEGRDRYFDGLHYTYEYRRARRLTTSSSPVQSAFSQRPKDWRFWLGSALLGLGVLAVFVTLTATNLDLRLTGGSRYYAALALSLAIHPLVWGGVWGGFLIFRWKQATD